MYTVSESNHRAIPFKIAGISVEMEYFIQICWYTTPLLTYTHISVYTSRHCIYPVHCLLSCASIGRYILHLVLNLVLQQLLKYKTYEAIFVKEKKEGEIKLVQTQKGDLKCLNLFITRYSLHCVCSDFCRYFVIKIFRTPKTTKTGVTRHN